jgi:hypothetical protein
VPAPGAKAWKTGKAILGYGNLNEGTLINYGPRASKKYITTYFRKTVNITDVAQFSSFTASTSTGRYDGTDNSCPYVLPPGKTNHGAVYVVAGSSGQAARFQETWPHNAMPFSDNEGGMLYLEVEQNRLDYKYLRSDGTVWDQFTILQDANKSTEVLADSSGNAQLTASWVGSYQWSTGETTRTITEPPGSETTYQVTDNTKCLTDNFKVIGATSKTAALKVESDAQKEKTLSGQLQIFPTVVQRGSRIKVQQPNGEQLVAQVFDVNGRLVYGATFSGTTYLETARLPLGLYLLRVQGGRSLKTQKFIIRE